MTSITDRISRLFARLTARFHRPSAKHPYQQMFDEHRVPKLIIEPTTTRIVDANAAAAAFYGYSVAQLKTMRTSDIHTLDETAVRAKIGQAFHEQPPFVEVRHRLASGQIRDVNIFGSRLDTPEGTMVYAIVVDVTAKREAERRYQALFEQSNDAVFILDLEGRHLQVNQRAAEMLGYQPDEVVGLTSKALVVPEEAAASQNILQRLLAGERIAPYERTFRRKDGTYIPTEVNVELVRDADGQPLYIQSIVRDITERKQLIGDLVEQYDELDRFFTLALDLLCIANTDGYFLKVNKAWEDILGYSMAELVQRRFLDFVHPDDLPATMDAIGQLSEQKDVLHFVNRYRTKDGSYRHIEWRSHPHGRLIYAAARDITERIQMEAELRAREEKFRAFVEQSSDGVVLTDEQGIISEWNQSMSRLTGIAAETAVGQPIWDVQYQVAATHLRTEANYQQLKAATQQVLQTGVNPWKNTPYESIVQSGSGASYFVQQGTFLLQTSRGYGLGSIVRDITAQRQMEDDLRQSELRYRTAIEASMDAYYLLESVRDAAGEITDFRVIQANSNAIREMGLPRETLIGGLICELFPINLTSGYFERYKAVVETGQPIEQEYQIPAENAAPGWYYHQVVRVGDGVAIVNRNITPRKQAEEALRRSEERLNTIVENIPVMIDVFDAEGKFEFISRHWVERLGWELDDLKAAEDPMALLFPDPAERQKAMDVILAGVPGWEDFSVVTKQHGILATTWANVRLSDGRTIGIGQDITERKRMEETLRQSEEKYRLIAENTSDGIVVMDGQTNRITYASPAYDRQYGRQPGDSVGRNSQNIQEIIHPDDADTIFQQVYAAVTAKEQKLTYSYRSKHTDGHYFWREDHTTFNYAPDGTYLNAYIISRDITERKQAQQQELELRLEKERTHLLTEFIQNAAHEFRTPLATITSSAYLMTRTDDAERRRVKREQIETQVKRITDLVDRLLLMTRLESDEAQPSTRVDVGDILKAECQGYAGKYGDTPALEVQIAPDLPKIAGRTAYLSQALHQVLDNAYRFTPAQGNIIVCAGAENGQVWITVRDSGPGILPEDMPHIFETFWRHDTAHTTPGFGLGLPIAQRIIQRHGGTITLKSEPGQGTEVRLTLPRR